MGDKWGHQRGGFKDAANVRRWTKHAICKICGRPTDVYHDDAKCEDAWIRRCDEDAGRAGTPC